MCVCVCVCVGVWVVKWVVKIKFANGCTYARSNTRINTHMRPLFLDRWCLNSPSTLKKKKTEWEGGLKEKQEIEAAIRYAMSMVELREMPAAQ